MRKSPTAKSTIKNDPFATVIPMALEAEISQATIPVFTPERPPENLDSTKPVEPETTRTASTEPRPSRKPRASLTERLVHAKPLDTEAARPGKQKLTVHLDAELANRVKNAAYWNPRLTIAGIAEHGIQQVIEKIEREHGGPYPAREGELVGGRPIK